MPPRRRTLRSVASDGENSDEEVEVERAEDAPQVTPEVTPNQPEPSVQRVQDEYKMAQLEVLSYKIEHTLFLKHLHLQQSQQPVLLDPNQRQEVWGYLVFKVRLSQGIIGLFVLPVESLTQDNAIRILKLASSVDKWVI
ncbi:uncharacterized protein G2W53_037189 [Senna tora]|uniref:Uncharacterized protein n=1 Tax=Senna tora TaxID=362788 RepID=A0A834SVE0_9FABA|nr:uncharacterized protein G2W53_037189 [Senna tora]